MPNAECRMPQNRRTIASSVAHFSSLESFMTHMIHSWVINHAWFPVFDLDHNVAKLYSSFRYFDESLLLTFPPCYNHVLLDCMQTLESMRVDTKCITDPTCHQKYPQLLFSQLCESIARMFPNSTDNLLQKFCNGNFPQRPFQFVKEEFSTKTLSVC